MKAPVSIAVAAAFAVLAAPVFAGGGQHPCIQTHRDTAAQAPRHGQPLRPGQPATQGLQPQATNPGMPSFHQPSYSIDRKDWWQPHPYFQSNGQGFGYPTHSGTRPYSAYGIQRR